MRNVTIVNNTIYGHPTCLFDRWSGATNMVLANNAVYCPGGTAVDGAGLTGATVTVRTNFVAGGMSGAAIDGSRFVAGGAAAAAFTNPADPRLLAAARLHLDRQGRRRARADTGFQRASSRQPLRRRRLRDGRPGDQPGLEGRPGLQATRSRRLRPAIGANQSATAVTSPPNAVSG